MVTCFWMLFVSVWSAANPEPGRSASGPLGPEGRGGDGGRLRLLCGAEIRSHDRKLLVLGPRKPVWIQKVSVCVCVSKRLSDTAYK